MSLIVEDADDLLTEAKWRLHLHGQWCCVGCGGRYCPHVAAPGACPVCRQYDRRG